MSLDTHVWAPLLVGNRAHLDFMNTGYRRHLGEDPLATWDDVLTLCRMIGMLDPGSGPAGTDTDLAAARHLRDALEAITVAHVAGDQLPAQAVAHLNAVGDAAPQRTHLAVEEANRLAARPLSPATAAEVLARIAHDAIASFANDARARFRRCANIDCPLYFYDVSKGGKRRWCRMDTCGNRAKAASHAQRHRPAPR